MKSLFLILTSVLIYSVSIAQENFVDEELEMVFRDRNDSTNYYLVLEPASKPVGLLMIIPGGFTAPGFVLKQTDLPSKARKKGYVVIIPQVAYNTFYLDTLSQGRLRTLVPEVLKKYNVPDDRFIIGGHSIGGHAAFYYAEKAFEGKRKMVKPAMVFGVDPPMDLKRVWKTHTYFLSRKDQTPSKESTMVLDIFRRDLGGTPTDYAKKYSDESSFDREAKDGGNIRHLSKLPVRLYTDPDLNWFINEWRAPIEHLNLYDQDGAIVQLRLLGNTQAELVTNPGKGYFPGGRRHPHGFSQLDADEFLMWAEKILTKK